MFNQNNNFSKDIIKLYLNNPSCLNIIFDYHLASGDLSALDRSGNNIVHHIVLKNDVKTLVSVLNCNRVNVRSLINQQNIDGDLPMHIAVRNENEEIAKMLDNAGTNKSIKNNNGENIQKSDQMEMKRSFGTNNNESYIMDKQSLPEDTIDIVRLMDQFNDNRKTELTYGKSYNIFGISLLSK